MSLVDRAISLERVTKRALNHEASRDEVRLSLVLMRGYVTAREGNWGEDAASIDLRDKLSSLNNKVRDAVGGHELRKAYQAVLAAVKPITASLEGCLS